MVNVLDLNLLVITFSFISHVNCFVHPDVGLSAKQLIQKYGYPLEVHSIVTKDGYILETHRIPHGKNVSVGAPRHSVLLWPGVFCDSSVYLTLGPEFGLGYILADKGFDVWLANYRGSRWSKKHTYLSPIRDAKKFFDFSFQEIALDDVTANIDYILNMTQNTKLFYIGHSQGTATFYAMASAKPKYNDKIHLMIGLAPFSNVSVSSNLALNVLKKLQPIIQTISKLLPIYEILPHTPVITLLGQLFCSDYSVTQPLCIQLLSLFSGYSNNLNKTALPLLLSNVPAGGSMKMLLHFMQLIVSGNFQMYNYGAVQNFLHYNQFTPPTFDTSKVSVPVAIYYGDKDAAVNEENVNILLNQLPNIVKQRKVEGYTHFDLLWATNVVDVLYQDIIQTMNMFTS